MERGCQLLRLSAILCSAPPSVVMALGTAIQERRKPPWKKAAEAAMGMVEEKESPKAAIRRLSPSNKAGGEADPRLVPRWC